MSKKPVKKSRAAKYDGPMTPAMKLFLAGCVAELYLVIVRRLYVNGTIDQMLAWYDYLLAFAAVGLAAAAIGLVLVRKWKDSKGKKELAWYLLGGGAFLAASSALVHFNMSALSVLTTLVPVALVVDILWWLFDKDSALSLTVLAGALVAVWLCRRSGSLAVKAVVVLFLLAIVILVAAVKKNKVSIPAESQKTLLGSCALAAIGAAVATVNTTLAYYAMWALAAVTFCVAVYYTVKQL